MRQEQPPEFQKPSTLQNHHSFISVGCIPDLPQSSSFWGSNVDLRKGKCTLHLRQEKGGTQELCVKLVSGSRKARAAGRSPAGPTLSAVGPVFMGHQHLSLTAAGPKAGMGMKCPHCKPHTTLPEESAFKPELLPEVHIITGSKTERAE